MTSVYQPIPLFLLFAFFPCKLLHTACRRRSPPPLTCVCLTCSQHRRLSYSRHAVNDRDLSTQEVNYRMHMNHIRRLVGDERKHHHKRSKRLGKVSSKRLVFKVRRDGSFFLFFFLWSSLSSHFPTTAPAAVECIVPEWENIGVT